MAVERSAGAVIYRKGESKNYYLLLHYGSGARRPKPYWDFPKGHIDKGEKPMDTARRETAEETGLAGIQFVKGFKETIKYFFKHEEKTIMKFATFYLARAKTKKVKISSEHIGYKWLPFKEALNRLTYKNAKDTLKKANQFLKNHAAKN